MQMTDPAEVRGSPTVETSVVEGGLGAPDVTQLAQVDLTFPVTRIDPDYSSYQALSPRTQPSGWTYTDPSGSSNLTMIKVTSSSVPYSNSGMMCGNGYADAGNFASHPWQSGDDWFITVATFQPDDQRTWLVDVQLTGAGANSLNDWRELTGSLAPQADVAFSFSNNASTPHIAHIVNGTTVHRIDTTNGSMALADTGNFPWTIGMSVGASPWLMHDKNDDWFVSTSQSSEEVRVWQESTDTKRTSSYNCNEGRMSRDGLYVCLSNISGDNYRCWNLSANTYSTLITGITQHSGSLQSRWMATNWDVSAPWRSCLANPTSWDDDLFGYLGSTPYDGGEVHYSGNWIQDVSGGYDNQYALGSASHSSNQDNWCKTGLVLVNTGGTDARYVGCSHAGPYGGNYWGLCFQNMSPSGHLAGFSSKHAYSNTNVTSRFDLYLAVMPRV